MTDVFVNEDATSVEEVVAVADDATTLLEDGGAAGAEDEGALELELAPALGTGATTPPCTVPPDCEEVPAALDL